MKHQIIEIIFNSSTALSWATLEARELLTMKEDFNLRLNLWKKQEYPSIHKTAHQFNVNDVAFGRRIKGGLSIAESCEQQQLLSIAEETALYLYNTRLSRQGYHPEPAVIKEMAEKLRFRR